MILSVQTDTEDVALCPQARGGATLEQLAGDVRTLTSSLYDSMTETVYPQPVASFAVDVRPQPVFQVDIVGGGRGALEKANDDLGESRTHWSQESHVIRELFSLSTVTVYM